MVCLKCKMVKDIKSPWVYHISKYFLVRINPKISPYLGRTGIIPKRHIGKKGKKYGLNDLNEAEVLELEKIKKTVCYAIEKSFEGLKSFSFFVKEESEHPDFDIIPHYEEDFEFEGLEFKQPKKNDPILLSYRNNQDYPDTVRDEIISMLKYNFRIE